MASPGWPRNYSHNENCAWNITVPPNKVSHPSYSDVTSVNILQRYSVLQVIRIRFTHLQLVVTSHEDYCDANSDRLQLIQVKDGEEQTSCVRPHTTEVLTASNQVFLRFRSNSNKDAQGFRAFYNAGIALARKKSGRYLYLCSIPSCFVQSGRATPSSPQKQATSRRQSGQTTTRTPPSAPGASRPSRTSECACTLHSSTLPFTHSTTAMTTLIT